VLIIVLVLLIVSIVGLITAVFVGAPEPAHPRHGTFGIDGLDGGLIAWGSVALCVLGLLVLFLDFRRARRRPAVPADLEDQHHTAGEELFGEHEVERDLTREN
jgi:hypothetical protein